jgi:hypothetical protein
MTRALWEFDRQLTATAAENDSLSQVILPKVWREMSPKSRLDFLFNNSRLPGRDQLINNICLGAREAAELTLQSNEAVNPAIKNIFKRISIV